jgi:hypothetical protein
MKTRTIQSRERERKKTESRMLTAMAAVRGGDLGTLTADLSRETGRRKLEEKKFWEMDPAAATTGAGVL